jgi:hypothetical protein
MGPIIIFDKSTLEGLNPDEAMWLDHFFLSNITPLFFVETLADLEKKVRSGRTPEQVVGSLAYKTPDFSSKPNVHHRRLLEAELLSGTKIELELGIPHISGGKTVQLEGRKGVIFTPSPEEEAFSRWQDFQFLDLERLIAKQWRSSLSNIDLEGQYRTFQRFYPMGKPKTLEEVKRFVDFYIEGPDQESVLRFGLTLVGVLEQKQALVLQRWRSHGRPSLRVYAPYFTYVFAVDFLFYLGIAADIIGRGRPSHKIDLAYLYYLPFCMIFSSNDKLHSEIAPLFMRKNQTFLPGVDLKLDLAKLDAHYSALSAEEKATGVVRFAPHPPKDDSFLTTRLWDKHMASTWRDHQSVGPRGDSQTSEMIQETVRRMKEANPDEAAASVSTMDDLDHMVIERRVHKQKGKWARFPPEIMERQD